MKTFKQILSMLLCMALLLGAVGCAAAPVETVPPTTQAPTEPPTDQVYNLAVSTLDQQSDLTLDLCITTTTTVDAQVFTEQRAQTLRYNGRGTENLSISMDETLMYDLSHESETEPLTYSEVYAAGTLYTRFGDDYLFSAALRSEEATARYCPAVLLDATLYGSLSSQISSGNTVISFADPIAPESWAIPEGAQMQDASGSATISNSGALQSMHYTLTYQYGSAEVTLDVESTIQATAEAVTIPDNVTQYTQLQYADALYVFLRTSGLATQAKSITTSSLESIFSQAGGVMRNQSTTMNLTRFNDDFQTKVDIDLFLMDYSYNQSQSLKQEEVYRDGKYTVTVDDGVPTTQSGVDLSIIKEYCSSILLSHMADPSFWADAVMTDLGSLYLIEYTYTEDFGNTIQNSISSLFWEEASYLNNLATAYVNNETTGYLSIDKYTGLPVSAGYYFQGTHTIQNQDYIMTLQSDQSIESPAFGAYREITGENLPESEPETQATPLFYHVTGTDGQEMWLLGTIHVGDARTAYLPQQIQDAFAASDALALECDTKAFEDEMESNDALQEQVSGYYYYSNGNTLEAMMDAADYTAAQKLLQAVGSYNLNMPYAKPYLWSNSIEQFYLRQGAQLHSDQGVEERLKAWAEEQDKGIREVESSLFQIQMLTGFSDELQLLMLSETMETTAQEFWMDTYELYDLWCSGDETALRAKLSEEEDTSSFSDEELEKYEAQAPLWEEYNNAISVDRNEGMRKAAIEYLESGDVVFYAVGLAHLLDSTNGLVDALRDAGYTVELVSYN